MRNLKLRKGSASGDYQDCRTLNPGLVQSPETKPLSNGSRRQSGAYFDRWDKVVKPKVETNLNDSLGRVIIISKSSYRTTLNYVCVTSY